MAAISVERMVEELKKMSDDMKAGNMISGEYDQRLARMIQELRDRGIDGDREAVTAGLKGALEAGYITDSVNDHLLSRLGIKGDSSDS